MTSNKKTAKGDLSGFVLLYLKAITIVHQVSELILT